MQISKEENPAAYPPSYVYFKKVFQGRQPYVYYCFVVCDVMLPCIALSYNISGLVLFYLVSTYLQIYKEKHPQADPPSQASQAKRKNFKARRN